MHSTSAASRALKRVKKLVQKEAEKIVKFQKQMKDSQFECKTDAREIFARWFKGIVYHIIDDIQITKKARFLSKGDSMLHLRIKHLRNNHVNI